MLRTDAYRLFRDGLFEAKLRPGQFISQRELCALLDVPLGPLREALKRLEADGLVQVLPQRGIRVTEVDRRFIRETFHLRRILEADACRWYAEFGALDELRRIERATTKILNRAGRNPGLALLEEAFEVDWRLHDLLIEAQDNRLIVEIHRVNTDKVKLIRLNGDFTPARVVPGMEEHLAVIEALLRRDAERAVAALMHHFDVAEARSLGEMA
ncbi:MAG: GntR family transcriptional regulator [Pseudomonadota bacterium]